MLIFVGIKCSWEFGSGDEDFVIDMVGVIVIDNRGYIVVGFFFGGIGMKYCGWIGFVVFVGIGIVVVLEDFEDEMVILVVVVISGIGEYMVMCIVFVKCVECLFYCIWCGFSG